MPDYQERETLVGDRPSRTHRPSTPAARPSPIRQVGHRPPEPEPTVPPEADPRRLPTPAVAEEAPRERHRRPPIRCRAGAYQYLKRWTFVLVVAGVWIVAAASGLGLYYWWYQSVDKTPSVFVVLIYLVVCTVGSLLIAMVQNKPLMSALAIALMSAPLASTAARPRCTASTCSTGSRSPAGRDPALLG